MATSILLAPLISMVNRKVSSYLVRQYQEMDGMEEQLAVLERKLPAILDVITDAEEQGTHRPGVSAWLKALKAVAYKANDVFDEFKYEALRREAKRKGQDNKFSTDAVMLRPAHSPILFRYRMGKKLRKIVHTIEVLVAEMNAFGFKYRQEMPASKQWRQTDSIIIDSENIISREAEKWKIVDMLLAHSTNKDVLVLPVVGMGGLGKTTFAQIIYNDPDIQKHFQLRKWVCVLDDFDVTAIANKISMSTEKDSESALEKLQQEISGRRYLLVLDDVWNRDTDKWAKLKYCLQQCGGSGSAILMTTRDERVAQIMGTAQAHQLVKMDKKDLLAIFEKRAFGLNEQKPDELVQIGKEIVDRCHGSPLAAKALGSMLSNQKSVEEWGAVLKKSSICDEESGILPILKLSYNDLPAHMKQCFAFCAVFPKNYVINVEKLIQLWMANDFIPSEDAIRPETKGKQIFNELVSRSFFQDVNQDGSGNNYMTTCTVHDLMHDVALSVMGKECVTIEERLNYMEILPYTVRHLFLSSHGPGTFLSATLKETCSGIQTMLGSIDASNSVRHLSKCTSLRALQLCYYRSSGLPFVPKHLKHLRYLDLSGNCHIKALPEEICIMYNLQTLNLSGCERLSGLPKDMKYMTGLRHLYTDGCLSLKCMPPNLGWLTSLQTLTYFVVGCSSGCSSIGELRHMNLRGQLQLCHLENVTEADITMGNHGGKKDLTQLSFAWKNDCSEVDFHEKVLDAFTPNRGLQILLVDSYRSIRFPTWMTNLSVMQDLVKLSLVSCTMCDRLPQLWQLPALQVLYLERMDRLHCLCIGDGGTLTSSTFPKLKELVLLDLKILNGWWEVKGRHGHQLLFPLLEELSIGRCNKLTNLPEPPMLGQSSSCNDNMARSAFPALKKLMLHGLKSLRKWGKKEEICGEQSTFPLLEEANIIDCPELSTLPEAPRLRVLAFPEDRPLIWLSMARYMTAFSNARLKIAPYSPSHVQCSIQQVDGKGKWNHRSSHSAMELCGSYFFHTSWKYFVNLSYLEIISCDELMYWPLKELQCLVSLNRLTVHCCNNLIGSAKILEESVSEGNQLLPCLEFLEIKSCPNLVEIFSLPPSLKELYIERCSKLEFIWGKQSTESQSFYVEHPDDLTLSDSCSGLSASAIEQDPSSLARNHSLPCLESLTLISCQSLVELLDFPLYLKEVHIWSCPKLEFIWGKLDKQIRSQYFEQQNNLELSESCSKFTAFTTVPGSLPSTVNRPLPCLEYLWIAYCEGLLEIIDLPSSVRTIIITDCPKLEVLSGQLHKLGHLDIRFCDQLRLIESIQGDFSSLETVSVEGCESLKCLPNKGSHT
ncbi:hypothetical protein CFC21_050191 [Triticum aestivum]|uniref:Uncharacterized protein n=2 Tax=Triticum aestivum TaxID=4565 RepID=A0A9R1G3J2_WHEAT|nr:putative disease resistance protein RGA4 [Triticum aestivum]KAF7040278.1 hypothetical protein CFC21_050191 [Triticum aestivum]